MKKLLENKIDDMRIVYRIDGEDLSLEDFVILNEYKQYELFNKLL